LYGDENGSFYSRYTYEIGSDLTSVVVGDFNNDNLSDLTIANQGSNTMSILFGNVNGSFQKQIHLTKRRIIRHCLLRYLFLM